MLPLGWAGMAIREERAGTFLGLFMLFSRDSFPNVLMALVGLSWLVTDSFLQG